MRCCVWDHAAVGDVLAVNGALPRGRGSCWIRMTETWEEQHEREKNEFDDAEMSESSFI